MKGCEYLSVSRRYLFAPLLCAFGSLRLGVEFLLIPFSIALCGNFFNAKSQGSKDARNEILQSVKSNSFTLLKGGVVFGFIAFLTFGGRLHAANPPLPIIPANNFNVTNYGAKGDGVTDNTLAISNAIHAAVAAKGGTVEIPAAAGSYLSGPITLYSGIRLQVDTNAMLQMLPYGTYPANSSQFIYCKTVQNLEISGGGTIDGQGQAWWVAYTNNNSLSRPLLLQLESCVGLYIHDITFQNPPNHHCGLRDSGGNITISNLTESAPPNSPNTDGLDFVGTNCLIENCHISVGDDNIALGSTGPLNGVVISNCVFGSGHGVSIGSTVSDGITNLTVINCSFNGTVNGIRMKTAQDAGTIVTGLNYLNLTMTNVGLPIAIWTYYNITETPTGVSTAEVLGTAAEPINATTPRWSNITISNLNIISGTSSQIGGIIWGPTEWPISNLTLVCITNNAPNTFELYNVYGVQIVDSQFNFSSGDIFTLCNAGLTISNSVPVSRVETITGAASANTLSLYNAAVSMSSTNLFAANPVSIDSGILADTSNLTLPASTTQNFAVGTNNSVLNVTGNLTLNGTVNISNAGGFAATNYTLFTYTGNFSGQPILGTTPSGFPGYAYKLNTNTPGKVMLTVSPPSPPTFSSASFVNSTGNLVFSGGGGIANGAYQVLTSTNLALPLNQWTSVATNQFDGSGNFLFSNSVSTNISQRFFRLQVP